MTWVLLRGLTREARHWGGFPELLQLRLRAAAIALDAPGNGVRHRERSPASVRLIAQACREDLLARGFEPPWSLMAMSLGAMVALEWSARWPGEISRAVLVNTSARGEVPPWKRLRPRNWGTLATIAARSPAAREARILAMTSNAPVHRSSLLREWTQIAETAPVSAGNALRQLTAAARFKPVRPEGVPLLLLASQADGLVSSDCSRALALQWNVPLRLHPWAGHDLPLDDPEWVAEQTAAWLHK